MDIQMPGIDGHALCERLREEHGDALILIAVTGAGDVDDRISGPFAKFDHYLRKPLDHDRLRQLLPPLGG